MIYHEKSPFDRDQVIVIPFIDRFTGQLQQDNGQERQQNPNPVPTCLINL